MQCDATWSNLIQSNASLIASHLAQVASARNGRECSAPRKTVLALHLQYKKGILLTRESHPACTLDCVRNGFWLVNEIPFNRRRFPSREPKFLTMWACYLRNKYYGKFLTFCENKYIPTSWKDEDNPGYRQVDVCHEDVSGESVHEHTSRFSSGCIRGI